MKRSKGYRQIEIEIHVIVFIAKLKKNEDDRCNCFCHNYVVMADATYKKNNKFAIGAWQALKMLAMLVFFYCFSFEY